MCDKATIKRFIKEEMNDLDDCVRKSGCSEDVVLSSLANCFLVTLNSFRIKGNRKSKNWEERVYNRIYSYDL